MAVDIAVPEELLSNDHLSHQRLHSARGEAEVICPRLCQLLCHWSLQLQRHVVSTVVLSQRSNFSKIHRRKTMHCDQKKGKISRGCILETLV